MQLVWTWQNVAQRSLLRALPTLLTATLCLCAFTVADGFSSSISSGIGNEVLLNGTNCGIKYLGNGLMGPLAENQWQLDVSYWWSTYLASLQAGVVNTARGPSDPGIDPYKEQPDNSYMREMCNNLVRYPFANLVVTG